MINILILIAICYLKVSYLISNWLKERDVITNKNIGRKSFNLEETRLKFTVGSKKRDWIRDQGQGNEIELKIKNEIISTFMLHIETIKFFSRISFDSSILFIQILWIGFIRLTIVYNFYVVQLMIFYICFVLI